MKRVRLIIPIVLVVSFLSLKVECRYNDSIQSSIYHRFYGPSPNLTNVFNASHNYENLESLWAVAPFLNSSKGHLYQPFKGTWILKDRGELPKVSTFYVVDLGIVISTLFG